VCCDARLPGIEYSLMVRTRPLTAHTLKRRYFGPILIAMALWALWALWAPDRLSAQTQAPAQTQQGKGASRASSFTPGLDDVMTLLVQPRHIRLFAAGTLQNWELAAFELNELRSSLDRVANSIPSYQGTDVREGIDSIMARSLQETSEAIHAGEVSRFMRAYETLTQACNACHAYLEHPFLKIRVPTKAEPLMAYPDQDFAPDPATPPQPAPEGRAASRDEMVPRR
jgi:hypothetical protein